ncbi:MAG: phenylalanine--tRNA ligase subunit beta [Candidatus Berkelbacteria bacterium]|nr:phenylalanine--tRNA ligase subunit beta [Candidatus Berkelbacteria bacterium]
MKYLKSWLEDYYKLPKDIDVCDLITRLGAETESLTLAPSIDENVVTARVLEVIPHPNADRLKLAKITTGKEEITVVCGAPNIEPGQCVAYARPGAKIRGGKVEKATIRGVGSPGMILSEREMGIGKDHSGIKALEGSLGLGCPVAASLQGEVVLDAEVTPNRGDLLSHFGLARDLAALELKKIEKPKLKLPEIKDLAEKEITVQLKSVNCPLYLARVVKGVKIAPSPDWLVKRLALLGVNPINNIVDATNYILFDLGHPLHAFDLRKLEGSKIVVRDLEKNEEVVTLDGEARELVEGMMVIAGEKRPVAIAGVMGLKNSEIDDETADVVIEAAVFDRKSIRKTAKLLGLVTEASYRFERGVDDVGVEYALDKAAKMIQEMAGGRILKGIVKAGKLSVAGHQTVEYQKINQLVGREYSRDRVDNILAALGFEVESGQARIPSWRHDITSWQDLAEEVARIDGIEKIKAGKPPEAETKSGESDWHKKEAIKDFLVSLGLTEALNYTFLSGADIKAAKLKTEDLLEVANPVQEENRYLRPSLVPGLLKSIARNPSFDNIEFFEIGNVFSKTQEKTNLAIATAGKGRKVAEITQELAKKFGFEKDEFSIFEIPRDELKRFKIKKPSVSIAEVDLGQILPQTKFGKLEIEVLQREIKYRSVSSFPSVSRDLAFVVDAKITLEEIKKEILASSNKAILVEPFDEFIDERFGKGKKSVAFHIYLQAEDRTLSDKEADGEIKKIISALEKKFTAKLRS